MKTSELERLLKKAGCKKLNGGTKHEVWINCKTGVRFRVGRHPSKEVAVGTVNAILKEAGLK